MFGACATATGGSKSAVRFNWKSSCRMTRRLLIPASYDGGLLHRVVSAVASASVPHAIHTIARITNYMTSHEFKQLGELSARTASITRQVL